MIRVERDSLTEREGGQEGGGFGNYGNAMNVLNNVGDTVDKIRGPVLKGRACDATRTLCGLGVESNASIEMLERTGIFGSEGRDFCQTFAKLDH